MKRRLFVPVFVMAGLLSASGAAASEVLFVYAFEAGSSHRYRVKLNQETSFGGNAIGQIADFEVSVTCQSVEEGRASMQMTFDKADMSREMFGNLTADPLAETITGKSVSYTVGPDGEAADIKPVGYFEGWDAMQTFVEPLIKSWYVPLPGKPVAAGGEWDHVRKDKGTGGMDVTTTAHYKFKEMKKQSGRECASVICDAVSALAGQFANQMGTFQVDGEGKSKVEFLFDLQAGIIVKLKTKSDMELDLVPAAGGDNAVTTNVSYQLERELL